MVFSRMAGKVLLVAMLSILVRVVLCLKSNTRTAKDVILTPLKDKINLDFPKALNLKETVSGSYDTYDTYRGAVVEYNPFIGNTPDITMQANVEKYIEFIKKAKAKGAEIIVFPENGLGSSITSPIPDPADRIAPCDSKTFVTTKAVKDLSRASKDNLIYSVVNLPEKRECESDDPNCPQRGYYIFNTNVVFDRSGVVIARYAKYNLYDEPSDQTADPEIVFFDTDFGVRFGTFICFDILFSTPAQRLVQQYKIKNFVFTTHWFSELPFLTALQVQRGWAETNDVNLLASGYNNPEMGSTGSGIYNGKYGHIAEVMLESKTSKLLIADIPKLAYSSVQKTETQKFTDIIHDYYNPTKIPAKSTPEPELHLLKDQMYLYDTEVINHGKVFQKTICSRNELCCDFHVDMSPLSPHSANYTFRAMAYSGVRNFGMKFRGGVQFCGVVLCNGPHVLNCTSRVKNIPELFKFSAIRIKGNFNLRNSFQMPSTLTDGSELKPLAANKYEFTSVRKELKSEVSLELLWPVYDLHTFAIWGRDFTRDMGPDYPIAGTSVLMPLPVMLASIIGFFVFAR